MNIIKKVWLTPDHEGGSLSNLTLESADPELPVSVSQLHFPVDPNPEWPRRHTIALGLFSDADLLAIRDAINTYLWAHR